MRNTILFIAAILAVVGMVPALYVGGMLMQATGSEWLFMAPILVLFAIAGECLHRVEA